MKEPDGMMDRIRDGHLNAADLEFVEYRLGTATGRSEVKVLNRLKSLIQKNLSKLARSESP